MGFYNKFFEKFAVSFLSAGARSLSSKTGVKSLGLSTPKAPNALANPTGMVMPKVGVSAIQKGYGVSTMKM